jgi:hypothetical protein
MLYGSENSVRSVATPGIACADLRHRSAGTPPRQDLSDTVLVALACNSLAECRGHLYAAGYELLIRGIHPTLRPLGGGKHIRLVALGLRTAFWLRFHGWGKSFASLGWGRTALTRFWKGLTGARLDAEGKASLQWFCTALGQMYVADAMCIAVRRLEHRPARERFLYCAKICRNRIKDGRDAAGHEGSTLWH